MGLVLKPMAAEAVLVRGQARVLEVAAAVGAVPDLVAGAEVEADQVLVLARVMKTTLGLPRKFLQPEDMKK